MFYRKNKKIAFEKNKHKFVFFIFLANFLAKKAKKSFTFLSRGRGAKLFAPRLCLGSKQLCSPALVSLKFLSSFAWEKIPFFFFTLIVKKKGQEEKIALAIFSFFIRLRENFDFSPFKFKLIFIIIELNNIFKKPLK